MDSKRKNDTSPFPSELLGSTYSSPSSNAKTAFKSVRVPNNKPVSIDPFAMKVPTSSELEESYKKCEFYKHGINYKESSAYNNEESVHPCHLSSSIHYGGQDVYTPAPESQSSFDNYWNASTDDDTEYATRGNWWKGSLYY